MPPAAPSASPSFRSRQPLDGLRAHRPHQAAARRQLGPITLLGEISGYKPHSSGHVYFSLKDGEGHPPRVIWRSVAARIPYDLENGLAVRVEGELNVYAPRGEYSLQIRKIEPQGIGPLELAYRQLSDKLEAEGLFSPARKRTLPPYPRRIVVVTSPRAQRSATSSRSPAAAGPPARS